MASPPRRAVQRWGPLLLWFACLLGAVALLRWLGAGRLAVPAVSGPGAWWVWATTGDPLTVAMAGLRVLGLGLAWYLTGVTGISVLARVVRAARMVRVADALSFGPVRSLAQQAAGVGLAAGVLVTAVPGAPDLPRAAPGPGQDVAVMVPVEDATAAAPAGLALREPVDAPVPAPTWGPPEGVPAATAAITETTASPVVTPTPAPPGPASSERAWVVSPGDHFWSIAEQEVARHLGRAGSEAEVLDHWEVLVDANTDRLVVPGNPDLLVPGQQVLLPEVAL